VIQEDKEGDRDAGSEPGAEEQTDESAGIHVNTEF
jgi:hypothetical protein